MKKEILLLGNEELYQISEPLKKDEIENIKSIVQNLHDTLLDFKEKYHAGRAIAAPQIGVKKRLLYMFIDKSVIFINPVLEFPDDEMMKVLDDCMSFPNLLVKVKRYKRCRIKYLDMDWKEQEISLEGELAELLQHEYDHLDGILATMRAIDNKSFVIKKVN